MKKKSSALLILFLLSFTFFANRIHATVCIAGGGANWSSAGNWSCGHVPTDNDTARIPAGITITVDIVSPTYNGMVVEVFGTLSFNVGMILNFDCNSKVDVKASGKLVSTSTTSGIKMCGAWSWNQNGTANGPFVLGPGPLPVEWQGVSASIFQKTQIQIKWTTATETHNNFFMVEKSTNGASFSEVGKVKGAGNSSQPLSYSQLDESPSNGTLYYRIKQVDYDGKFQYSQIIAVYYSLTTNGCVLKVYPNPCTGQCNIDLTDCDQSENPEITVELIDAVGNKVYSKMPVRDNNGSFSMSIDSSNNLKPGVYIVRGSSKKENYTYKMLVK